MASLNVMNDEIFLILFLLINLFNHYNLLKTFTLIILILGMLMQPMVQVVYDHHPIKINVLHMHVLM